MGTVTRFSVFEFSGGPVELFSYLHEQKKAGNTVAFANEGITITPESTGQEHVALAVYAAIAENPRVVEDYVRYLTAGMKKEAE